MTTLSFHKKRDVLLDRLVTLTPEGTNAMPAARANIDSYLSGKGRHAEKKWRRLLAKAEHRSPRAAAFARESRTAEANCPNMELVLPHEILGKIAQHCGAQELGRLSQVSKTWNQLLKPQSMWQHAYPSEVPHRRPQSGDWRNLVVEQATLASGQKAKQTLWAKLRDLVVRMTTTPETDTKVTPEMDIVAWQLKPRDGRQSVEGLSGLIEALIAAKRFVEAGNWVRELAWRHQHVMPQRLYEPIQDGDPSLLQTTLDAGVPLEVITAFVEVGVSVHYRSVGDNRSMMEGKSTPLMFAAKHGNVDAVKFLIGRGANVRAVNQLNNPAMHHALMGLNGDGPHFNVVAELIKAGAPVDHRFRHCYNSSHMAANSTPLMFAARHGKVDAVKFLIDQGADVWAVNELNNSAMHHALVGLNGTGPHFEVIRALADAGLPVPEQYREIMAS